MPAGAHSQPQLRYRYPARLVAGVARDLLRGRARSFAIDAARLARTVEPPPQVEGLAHIPVSDPFVAVFNHYRSPTFPAWWSAIVLTALIASRRTPGRGDLSWIMTEAWTYPDRLRSLVVTPLTRRAFRRLARLYGFIPMPPMPPRPHEVEARARAVRRALALVRQPAPPVLGLSPEGHDSPDGSLLRPPPGVGRFLLQLAAAELRLLPAGLYEDGGGLIVRFGRPFALTCPDGTPRVERDRWAAEEAMAAVGRLLPPAYWGFCRERLAGEHTRASR
ncbi:MAG: hypothetical protein QME94_05770 [Anaerolineae bacterium]|nr:hypothetical protein [Anaerolineae bacterium]